MFRYLNKNNFLASIVMNQKALIVLTSVDRYPENSGTMAGQATGFHFDEMANPYWALSDAGISIDFASTKSGVPPVDPTTVGEDGNRIPTVQRFLDDPVSQEKLENSKPISEISFEAYDLVLLVGGHGVMWDFRDSAPLADFVGKMFSTGRIVGAVCHGPAGILSAKDAAGEPIVKGRHINGFTDAEEIAANFKDAVPYMLETELRKSGALFENAGMFQSHAVRDGNLVTGQNPMSVHQFSNLLLEALRSRSSQL